MSKVLRLLLVEDSEADAAALRAELKRAGFEGVIQHVDSPEALREALAQDRWDAVVSAQPDDRNSRLARIPQLAVRIVSINLDEVSDSSGLEDKSASSQARTALVGGVTRD